ncbi:MAG: SNF2-related protein, partial [Brevinematales bacterium]
VEVELHELQEGFFEIVFWVVIDGERFPLRHDDIHQTILQRKHLLFQQKKRVWFLSPESEGYKKIQNITEITLTSFSRFLGEVKQHIIQSHDMKTLFEKYLDQIQPFVKLMTPWKRVTFEKVVFDVVPLKNMDWLEVDFSLAVDGRILTAGERTHIVKYGYVKYEDGFVSLASEKRAWLTQLEEAWFLRKKGEKLRLYPSHIFLLRDIIEKAKDSWGVELRLSSLYQNLSFRGEVLDRSIPIPEKVAPFLRPYQREGYWWLHFLYRYHFGGFLADEMGLGKTLQMIAFLLSIKGNGQCIIVCPSALMHNWAKEITKFVGDEIRFLVMDGSLEKRVEKQKRIDEYDVLITSYSLLHQDREFYHARIFHLCVLDEAQHIKNKKARRTQSLKALQAYHRVAITGTPIENTITEMWNIFDFLMPGFLGSHSWFSKTFEIPLQSPVASQREEARRRLRDLLKPFILRRTKKEVLSELPPKIEQEVWLDLTESQK